AVRGLADASVTLLRVPFGAEVAALHLPIAILHPDADIGVRVADAGGDQVHIEGKAGAGGGGYVPGVAVLQNLQEGWIVRAQGDGDTADCNHNFMTWAGGGSLHGERDSTTRHRRGWKDWRSRVNGRLPGWYFQGSAELS